MFRRIINAFLLLALVLPTTLFGAPVGGDRDGSEAVHPLIRPRDAGDPDPVAAVLCTVEPLFGILRTTPDDWTPERHRADAEVLVLLTDVSICRTGHSQCMSAVASASPMAECNPHLRL